MERSFETLSIQDIKFWISFEMIRRWISRLAYRLGLSILPGWVCPDCNGFVGEAKQRYDICYYCEGRGRKREQWDQSFQAQKQRSQTR